MPLGGHEPQMFRISAVAGLQGHPNGTLECVYL